MFIYIRNTVLVAGLLLTSELFAQSGDQEKLGLPGDNLNLYAVMKIFQESPTLEDFEKKLNAEDDKVNNLDLDGDDKTDYITVTDEVEGKVHNIVLRVAISATESQDIAVFTVDRDEDGKVEIQLTGDEELYGKDYIIEPNTTEGGATPNPGYAGKSPSTTRALDDKQIVVNSFLVDELRTWPMVTYLYMPAYPGWHSPYYYGYYPGWWRPWRPWYWDQYYGYHYNYYNYYWGWYRRWPSHRRPYWNDYYYRTRRYSPAVYNRRQGGFYRNTYSRPDLRRDGVVHYQKINPSRPVLQPGINKPAPRPTRPSPARPAPTRPDPNRPLTRPAPKPNPRPTPPTISPNPRPTQPVTRPAPKPTQPRTRPAPKPTQPVTRPAPAPRPAPKPAPKPAPRPAPTRENPKKAVN